MISELKIRNSMKFARKMARGHWYRLPEGIRSENSMFRGVDISDVEDAAFLGLVMAASTYDETIGDFEPYAVAKIRGAIKDFFKQELRWSDRNLSAEIEDTYSITENLHKNLDLPILLARMEEQEAVAVAARLRGHEFSDIGMALGISGTAVCQKVWSAVSTEPKND